MLKEEGRKLAGEDVMARAAGDCKMDIWKGSEVDDWRAIGRWDWQERRFGSEMGMKESAGRIDKTVAVGDKDCGSLAVEGEGLQPMTT